jgi:hypothetical protein
MTTATTKTTEKTTQTECIDLPGETVRCWRSADNIKIVLRKHRDVIFDYNLENGATYLLESTMDKFYDAGAKKLVRHATFKDGERFHIWIARGFKGELILKSSTGSVTRYNVAQLDPHTYDEIPTTKPAPIIFSMMSTEAARKAVMAAIANTSLTPTLDWTKSLSADAPVSSTVAQQQIMRIVEVKKVNVDTPKEIADFFEHGGEETAIDSGGFMSRNWLLAQIVGAVGYYNDNKHWIKELWGSKFYLKKIVHKNAGTKWYIIFKEPPGLREFLNAAKYGVEHEKVLAISMGVGSAAGMRHAAWEATKGAFRKAGLLAVVFTITLDIAEWHADYEKIDPKTGKRTKDFFDLFAKVGMDLVYAAAGAALAVAVMAGFLAIGLVAGGVAVVVGAIAVSVVVGLGFALADQEFGITKKVAQSARDAAQYLHTKLPQDYDGFPNMVTGIPSLGMQK